MADRYPLVANSSTNRIEELAINDNLNLSNNGIVGASTVRASSFIGDLIGTASTATQLTNASQILGGASYLKGSITERLYREVRVQAIGGGSEEIMRDLASRQLGI